MADSGEGFGSRRDWVISEQIKGKIQNNYEQQITLVRASIDYGLEAIRTAAIINGGAVIACFAFIGAFYTGGSKLSAEAMSPLISASGFFVAGAVLAGAASGVTYFTQLCFSRAALMEEPEIDFPFSKPTVNSIRANDKGEFWRTLAVSAIIVAYVCTIVGGYKAVTTLSGLLTIETTSKISDAKVCEGV